MENSVVIHQAIEVGPFGELEIELPGKESQD
jgi:hypothetical protein